MNITTAGIDLAKDVITVYAQDAQGKCVLSRNFHFKELAEWLVQLPEGCVIGMEACSTAHYWVRRMQTMGLQPRLMAAEFVQAFRSQQSFAGLPTRVICISKLHSRIAGFIPPTAPGRKSKVQLKLS